MSTKAKQIKPSTSLFGKTRQGILGVLFTHPDEAFYFRQLVRAAGVSPGAAQREVKELESAGIIKRVLHGRLAFYQANPQCPFFDELKGLVTKSFGVGDVIRSALAQLADHIDAALLYGSFARGDFKSGSDIDVLIVGDVGFGAVVSALSPIENTLGREINPTVYSIRELQSKKVSEHYVIESVLNGPSIYLIGNSSELKRLVEKRLVG